MNCPLCSAPLQLLTGGNGYAVALVPVVDNGWIKPGAPRVEERRIVANVYACPACEYAQIGSLPLVDGEFSEEPSEPMFDMDGGYYHAPDSGDPEFDENGNDISEGGRK
jgi:hypothetical protein